MLAILCSLITIEEALMLEELRFLRWQKERMPSSSVSRDALLEQQPKTKPRKAPALLSSLALGLEFRAETRPYS